MILAQIALATILAAPAECTRANIFGRPDASVDVVVATALGEIEVVAVDPDPILAFPVERTVAHRFLVDRVLAPNDRIAEGDQLLIIPWGYDDACRRTVLTEEWMPAGSRGLFQFSGGRASSGGERLIDLYARHQPYPQGAFLRYMQMVEVPEDTGEWLSADEYFDLLEAVPAPDPDDPSGRRLRQTLEILEAGPAVWTTRFPGTQIHWQLRRWLGDRVTPPR